VIRVVEAETDDLAWIGNRRQQPGVGQAVPLDAWLPGRLFDGLEGSGAKLQ